MPRPSATATAAVGAISMAGPAFRLPLAERERIRDLLVEAGDEVTKALAR